MTSVGYVVEMSHIRELTLLSWLNYTFKGSAVLCTICRGVEQVFQHEKTCEVS